MELTKQDLAKHIKLASRATGEEDGETLDHLYYWTYDKSKIAIIKALDRVYVPFVWDYNLDEWKKMPRDTKAEWYMDHVNFVGEQHGMIKLALSAIDPCEYAELDAAFYSWATGGSELHTQHDWVKVAQMPEVHKASFAEIEASLNNPDMFENFEPLKA